MKFENMLTEEGKIISDITSVFINKNREIEKLNNIINELKKYIKDNKSKLPMGRNEFTCEMRYSDEVVIAKDLENILYKGDIK